MNVRTLDEVGAVHICAPADQRPDLILQALAAGSHVYCDPPMALDSEACGRLLDSAHGPILMIGHRLRFRPEYRFLRDFVMSGAYGRIRSATFIRHCGNPNDRPGGSLINLLIDDIDQALLLFGKPAQVSCKSFAGPETAMGTLVYPGGSEVRIQGGWLPAAARLTESFQVRADDAELSFSREGLFLNDAAGERRNVGVSDADKADAALQYFIDCCRVGQQPVECPPADAALAVRIALLLKQSREMGGQPLKCRI